MKLFAKPTTEPDIFQKSMGTFSRYQCCFTFLILLLKLTNGLHLLNIIIIGPHVKTTCSSNGTDDPCSKDCESRIIDPDPFDSTIQSEWELACDSRYLATLAQTLVMAGILVGNGCFGILSDRIGRLKPLVIAIIIQSVAATAAAFVPWIWLFLLLRFVAAFGLGATMCTSFVLYMEVLGKRYFNIMSPIYHVPAWTGHILLSPIGYFIREWRHSQLFISAPLFLLISYYWLLPESPRYLLNAGKTEKAIKIMEKIAKCNQLPTENIAKEVNAYADSIAGKNNKGKCVYLLNTKIMLVRTLILSGCWIVCGLCFYGVAQYAGRMGGNVFANIAISAAAEVPASFFSILVLEILGAKWTLFAGFILAGSPMLVIPFLEEDSSGPIIMSVIALFGLIIAFTAVYQFTGELYPTSIRSVGVGMTSMMARFGSIVAPFIGTLNTYTTSGVWLTPLIFGTAPMISALLLLFLPSTHHAKLPESMEEAANIGKKTKEGKE